MQVRLGVPLPAQAPRGPATPSPRAGPAAGVLAARQRRGESAPPRRPAEAAAGHAQQPGPRRGPRSSGHLVGSGHATGRARVAGPHRQGLSLHAAGDAPALPHLDFSAGSTLRPQERASGGLVVLTSQPRPQAKADQCRYGGGDGGQPAGREGRRLEDHGDGGDEESGAAGGAARLRGHTGLALPSVTPQVSGSGVGPPEPSVPKVTRGASAFFWPRHARLSGHEGGERRLLRPRSLLAVTAMGPPGGALPASRGCSARLLDGLVFLEDSALRPVGPRRPRQGARRAVTLRSLRLLGDSGHPPRKTSLRAWGHGLSPGAPPPPYPSPTGGPAPSPLVTAKVHLIACFLLFWGPWTDSSITHSSLRTAGTARAAAPALSVTRPPPQ